MKTFVLILVLLCSSPSLADEWHSKSHGLSLSFPSNFAQIVNVDDGQSIVYGLWDYATEECVLLTVDPLEGATIEWDALLEGYKTLILSKSPGAEIIEAREVVINEFTFHELVAHGPNKKTKRDNVFVYRLMKLDDALLVIAFNTYAFDASDPAQFAIPKLTQDVLESIQIQKGAVANP